MLLVFFILSTRGPSSFPTPRMLLLITSMMLVETSTRSPLPFSASENSDSLLFFSADDIFP